MALTDNDLEKIDNLITKRLDEQTVKFDERFVAQTESFDNKLETQSTSLKEYIHKQTDIIVREIAGAVADITENVGQLVDKNYKGQERRISSLEKKLES